MTSQNTRQAAGIGTGWKELLQVLNGLNKSYEALIELSQKKHKALVFIDIKSIEAMNDTEAKLTQDIRQLEERRQKALIHLAVENRAIKKDTRMAELARYAPTPQIRVLLQKLHEALTVSTTKAQELRENNRVLIEGALSAVTYHLNRIGGTHVENTYGSSGQEVVTHARNFEYNA
ncbi:MAG: flagellar protein FlgN [Veillonellaceae bacterium]|nr:flagellar protein FlgN [Veillonellaceae bacterium]